MFIVILSHYIYIIPIRRRNNWWEIYIFSNINGKISGWFYRISLMLTWRDIIFPLNLFLDYEESILRSVAFLFMLTKLDMNESTNTKIIIQSHSQNMKRILSRYMRVFKLDHSWCDVLIVIIFGTSDAHITLFKPKIGLSSFYQLHWKYWNIHLYIMNIWYFCHRYFRSIH